MTELTMPQCPLFKFRMNQMKRIKNSYPEITINELNHEIQNRWELIDKKIREGLQQSYYQELKNYSMAKRNQATRKRTATSEGSFSQRSNQY